jgi:hypothetical protein
MTTAQSRMAFASSRSNNNPVSRRLAAVLAAIGGAAIVCSGFELADEVFLFEPGLRSFSLSLELVRYLTGVGGLLGCTGFVACRFLESRSYPARWQRYLCASAFVISVFALLIRWFGVSGSD